MSDSKPCYKRTGGLMLEFVSDIEPGILQIPKIYPSLVTT